MYSNLNGLMRIRTGPLNVLVKRESIVFRIFMISRTLSIKFIFTKQIIIINENNCYGITVGAGYISTSSETSGSKWETVWRRVVLCLTCLASSSLYIVIDWVMREMLDKRRGLCWNLTTVLKDLDYSNNWCHTLSKQTQWHPGEDILPSWHTCR